MIILFLSDLYIKEKILPNVKAFDLFKEQTKSKMKFLIVGKKDGGLMRWKKHIKICLIIKM